MKTVEELMRPRYKVVALWPKCKLSIGDILHEFITLGGAVHYRKWGKKSHLLKSEILAHPHLFAPLPWYAERSLSDMPEYVKETKSGSHGKVTWRGEGSWEYWMCIDQHETGYPMSEWHDRLTPATESEYLTYINSKK